jgi:ATP-dependent Clp protease ATP-binding subunit ClpC
MTSILGTADLRKSAIGFAKGSEAVTYERMKERVNTALKAHFRPEFLNRIDDVIVFHELAMEEVIEIADLLLQRTKDQLALQGIGLELTPAARKLVAEKGYDPMLGARPLRRAIQSMIEDPLSEKLLWKEFRTGETILVDVPEPGSVEELSFSAIEGFVPPTVELAGSAPGAD